MYYQPTNQTPENDLVDERWDGNLGYCYSSESSLKDKPVETLFNNINVSYNDDSKQVSPPYTISSVSSMKSNSLNTAFFREDVSYNDEYKDYFQCGTPSIVVDFASPFITEQEGRRNDLLGSSRAVDKDQEDFSIISLDELTPNGFIEALKQQEIEKNNTHTLVTLKQPVSIESYHLDLVQHYLKIVLRKTDPNTVSSEVMQTLPTIYVSYIQNIRETMS